MKTKLPLSKHNGAIYLFSPRNNRLILTFLMIIALRQIIYLNKS